MVGGKNAVMSFFLLFPLGVITDETMADLVLHDVSKYLAGEHGIRRYLVTGTGRLTMGHARPKRIEHAISATTSQARHAPFQGWRRSAVVSLRSDRVRIYGRRYRETSSVADRERQVFHFNRSLAQITDDWRCAELYHLRQSEYVANPHVPLQWT